MAVSVPRSRVLALLETQCRVFQTTFNPERLRTGNKILRQRLKGPSLASYYPPRDVTYKDLKKAFPDVEMWDDDEEDRLEHVQILKARGKGAPKKRSKIEDSKKAKGGKKK